MYTTREIFHSFKCSKLIDLQLATHIELHEELAVTTKIIALLKNGLFISAHITNSGKYIENRIYTSFN